MWLISSATVGGSFVSIRQLLLPGLLAFVLLLAPFTFTGSVHAAEAHAHVSMSHETGPDRPDHPDHGGHGHVGHGLVHCGWSPCSPSYVAGMTASHALRAMSRPKSPLAGDDAPRRSLYLDRDPPVPRGGVSQA